MKLLERLPNWASVVPLGIFIDVTTSWSLTSYQTCSQIQSLLSLFFIDGSNLRATFDAHITDGGFVKYSRKNAQTRWDGQSSHLWTWRGQGVSVE